MKKTMQTIAAPYRNGEYEKVLHWQSNINEIVSAGEKNFLPKRSTT